jgi:prepilin-type N-terminal cleavage/methylation domain-containing protein
MENKKTNNAEAHVAMQRRFGRCGFTLLEVLTALAILAFVSTSVLVVIDRCIIAVTDSSLRMEAFTVARENMEKILASTTVAEKVEYGTSDTNADISWQTTVEAFSEPIDGTMWVRAICSAEYEDTSGETQTVTLEHWITELTDQQADQIMGQEDLEQLAADQLVETPEEAAQHAGVGVETIEQWVENGLLTTEDGFFIRYNLDIYKQNNGNPPEDEKAKQVGSIEELALSLKSQQQGQLGGAQMRQGGSETDPLTGLPYEELEEKNIGEVMELLQKRQPR